MACIIAGAMWMSFRFVTAASDSSTDDAYGYSVESRPFSWIDPTVTGTLVVFPSPGNSFTPPIPFGFTFPFYENEYTAVHLSTNGLLSFGQGTLAPINTTIPFSVAPNNFAAPYWADLDVGGVNSGEAWYQVRGTAPNRSFVVAYLDVTGASSPSELLTFEALFHERGDICYQYGTMQGDLSAATIGIEDPDGVIGIDQSGTAAENTQLCFIRPEPAARVKLLPPVLSGFLTGGNADYILTVKNTGELGTDAYDLSYVSSLPGWNAQFSISTAAGTEGPSQSDTGPIPEGGSALIDVYVSAPLEALPGESAVITLTATSQLNPLVEAQTVLLAAIPASFAHIFQDSQSGLQLELFSNNVRVTTGNLAGGTPSGLTMAASSEGQFFVFWERSYVNVNGKSVSDLQYTLVSPSGIPLVNSQTIASNINQILPTRDRVLSAAGNEDGDVGVLFLRDIADDTVSPVEINSNVYFALLDSDGNLVSGPVNLTLNAEYRAPDDLDEPFFESPRISSVGSSFSVAWVENRLQAGLLQEEDVNFGIVNGNGTFTFGPVIQVNGSPGGDLAISPIVQSISGGRTLIAYARTSSTGTLLDIRYAVRDAGGGVVLSPSVLPGAVGSFLDAVELDSGNVLLVWVDGLSNQVNYAILDNGYNVISGPNELSTLSGRKGTNPSATSDTSGRGVITWMDATGAQFLYYGLVDESGNVVTPPISMRTSTDLNAIILTSSNGGGNAAFQRPNSLYLPLLTR